MLAGGGPGEVGWLPEVKVVCTQNNNLNMSTVFLFLFSFIYLFLDFRTIGLNLLHGPVRISL